VTLPITSLSSAKYRPPQRRVPPRDKADWGRKKPNPDGEEPVS